MIPQTHTCLSKTGLVLLFVTVLSCSSKDSIKEASLQETEPAYKSKFNINDPGTLKAVSEYSVYQTNFMVGGEAYTFNDAVVLRKADRFDSEKVEVLGRNTKVKIEELGAADSTGSIHDFWYKVKTDNTEGFVWGRDLALITLPLKTDTEEYFFSYGLSGYGKDGHIGKGLLIKDNAVVQELEIEPIQAADEENYNFDVYGSVCENAGLSGVRNIIRLSMAYGACGYENGDIIVLWDGNKLFKGPAFIGMFDAGFYYSRPYVFYPKDSAGLKDKIVVKQLSEEVVDEEKEVIDEKLKVSVYSWTPGSGIEAEF